MRSPTMLPQGWCEIPPQRSTNKVPYKAVGWLSVKIRVVTSRVLTSVLRKRLQRAKRCCKRRIFRQTQQGVRLGEALAKKPPCSSRCFTVSEGQCLSRALFRPSGVKGAALRTLVPLLRGKGTACRGLSGVLDCKGCIRHRPCGMTIRPLSQKSKIFASCLACRLGRRWTNVTEGDE